MSSADRLAQRPGTEEGVEHDYRVLISRIPDNTTREREISGSGTFILYVKRIEFRRVLLVLL